MHHLMPVCSTCVKGINGIDNNFRAAGMSRDAVSEFKKAPNLSAMFDDIGWSRQEYVILQSLGSHAVHGNWPILLKDYLKEASDDMIFRPNPDSVEMHINDYIVGCRFGLTAVSAYVGRCFKDRSANGFQNLVEAAEEALLHDYRNAVD